MLRPKPGISKPGPGMSKLYALKILQYPDSLDCSGLIDSDLFLPIKNQHFPPYLKTMQRLMSFNTTRALKSYPILYEPPVTEKDVKNS